MLQFKDGQQQEEAFYTYGHPKIKLVAHALDIANRVLGEEDVVITSAVRPPHPTLPDGTHKKSFHPKGQAIDVRTKNRTRQWIQHMIYQLETLKTYDPKIQWVLEGRGKENEHLHIEYDTGDPV